MTSTEHRPATVHGGDLAPVSDLLEALVESDADPLAARRSLREQIDRFSARLRRELGDEYAAETLRIALRPGPVDGPGPRLLDLTELEQVRDELVARLDELHDTAAARHERFAGKRALLAAMYADPDRHRGVRVTQPEIGESGCTRWAVRPVLGPVGRLAGWWRVRMSSGCP